MKKYLDFTSGCSNEIHTKFVGLLKVYLIFRVQRSFFPLNENYIKFLEFSSLNVIKPSCGMIQCGWEVR